MKKWTWIFLILASAALFAGEPGKRSRGAGKDPLLMQLFAQLDDAEREKLRELQHTDPVAYRQEIERRLVTLREEQAERSRNLQKLIDEYRAGADPRRQAEIKAKLTEAIGAGFDRNLAAHRKQLEHLKQRTAQLEKEVQSRAERRDEVVKAYVEALLAGEKSLPSPESRRGQNGKKRQSVDRED